MISITLKGDIPSKKNSKRMICRGARPLILPSKAYEDWHEEQLWALKPYGRLMLTKVKLLSVVFYPSTARKADSGNKYQSVTDLLVDAGIIEDDNWFVLKEERQRFGRVDRKNPRAEVIIVTE